MREGTRQPLRDGGGFTIVELLIVIIVIGILATMVLLAYSNVQQSARMAKMQNDITALRDAISIARNNTGETFGQITSTYGTAYDCEMLPDGTNLATVPQTNACWTRYHQTLQQISTAAGVSNLVNMVDPWGRPYFIDENEGEYSYNPCRQDIIAAYPAQFISNAWTTYPGTSLNVPFSLPDCSSSS